MRYQRRLDRARQAMADREIDLLFLSPSASMQYLTGIPRERPDFGAVNYPGGWVLGVLLGRDNDPIILAPRMVADYHLPAEFASHVRVLPDRGDPALLMAQALAEFGPVRRAAVENRAWAEAVLALQGLLPEATWTTASEILAPLRMIKDDDEIAAMRAAARLADGVMAAILPRLRVGMSEIDVSLEVDAEMVRLGAQGTSFTTALYVIGPDDPREMRERQGRRPLRPGVSLSFDFGCVYEGYCSDFGRTVHIGEPSAEFRRAYTAVIGAHDAAIAAMKSGQITAEGANSVARSVIDDAGFGQHFRHRLGHGIGLDVHEAPFLAEGDTTVLQEGMAFTVEPSIFWVGAIGARIEDVVVVRSEGAEVLNRYPSTLAVVDA